MLRQDANENPSLDPKMAEEALALAIRLQQENADRVTLEELQRTAEEAGIHPAHLKSALKTLTEESQALPVPIYTEGRVALMALTAMFSFVAILADTSPHSNNAPLLPFMLTVLAVGLALLLVFTWPRRSRRR